MRSENNIGMYCHFIHFLFKYFYNPNIKIKHFCYFQNSFPFVFMSRQTYDIGKKRPKHFMRQTIDLQYYEKCKGITRLSHTFHQHS